MKKSFLLCVLVVALCLNGCVGGTRFVMNDDDSIEYNGYKYVLRNDVAETFTRAGDQVAVGWMSLVGFRRTEIMHSALDTEQNILYDASGIYFWAKEGFSFPDIETAPIAYIRVSKYMDIFPDDHGNVNFVTYDSVKKEFSLEDAVTLKDVVSASTDSIQYDRTDILQKYFIHIAFHGYEYIEWWDIVDETDGGMHFYDDAERMYFCIDDAYKDIFYQAKMK